MMKPSPTNYCMFCEYCGVGMMLTPIGEKRIEERKTYECCNCCMVNVVPKDFIYLVKATRESD